jgi:RHS repeat-associated protein
MLIDTNQSAVATYRYDPFGNAISSSGSLASANVYRFSSKEIHVASAMYYYGYRFYDPNLQRWLNRDPIMEGGGMNLYGFVLNDPIDSIDLVGLCVLGDCSDADLKAARSAYQRCLANAERDYTQTIAAARNIREQAVSTAAKMKAKAVALAEKLYGMAVAKCNKLSDPGDQTLCQIAAQQAKDKIESAADAGFGTAKLLADAALTGAINGAKIQRAADKQKCLNEANGRCPNFKP